MIHTELLVQGLSTSVIGILIVVFILSLISICLSFFKYLNKQPTEVKKVQKEKKAPPVKKTFTRGPKIEPKVELELVNKPEEKTEERPEKKPELKTIIKPEVQAKEIKNNEVDDLELIAVIVAAIASCENTSVDNIVVKSIRRTSTWNNTAKNQVQQGVF